MSAPLPIPSSTRLSLEELKALLPARPAAIILGPRIASALSGRSVVLKDLLQSGLRLAFDNIGINEKLKQQVLPSLDNFDLLRRMRVGSLLESFAKTKSNLLADWLREAIGPPLVANPAVAAPLLKAAQTGFALASATYDGLLETATGLKSMTWLEFHGLSQLLTPPTLLRLYGTWDQPESIVRALPGASGAELHQRAIDTLLNDLQLVVTIGAAVPLGEDPLLEGMKRRGEGLPGVVICSEDEVETAQAFLTEHLPWFRIAPYSGGNEALPRVLASLFGTAPLPGVSSSAPKPLPPTPRAARVLVRDAGSAVLDLAYAPSNGFVVTGQSDGRVGIWDDQGGLVRSEKLEHEPRVWSVATHSKFDTAVAGDESGRLVWLFTNLGRSGYAGQQKNPSGTWALSFDGGSDRLAVARDSGHVEIWEPWKPFSIKNQSHPFRQRSVIHAHTQGALGVAFSRDGQTLASAGHDKAIRFWSVPYLNPLSVLEGHDDWVGSIAYSPDGKTLASTGGDKTVILWDLETGKPLWRSSGHTEWVQSLSFHPSGELIATGSWDKTIRVWDASNGQLLRTFDGHTERVWTVAFSPDGTWLASGGDDRTIRLWPIDVAELKARVASAPEVLPSDFIDLSRTPERLARFLARLTLRHREGLPLLNGLEPACLADALRPSNVLAATSSKDFAERTLALEKSLDSSFEPPPLWLAWMQHVRRTELTRLGQELVALSDRAKHAESAPSHRPTEEPQALGLVAEQAPSHEPEDDSESEVSMTSSPNVAPPTNVTRPPTKAPRRAVRKLPSKKFK